MGGRRVWFWLRHRAMSTVIKLDIDAETRKAVKAELGEISEEEGCLPST